MARAAPINEREARFRYTAAAGFAAGLQTAAVRQRLREVYGFLSPAEVVQYTAEGRRAYDLGVAYLQGTPAQVQAAEEAVPVGEQGQRVLTFNASWQPPEPFPGAGQPPEQYRTVRIVVTPGMTLDEIRQSIQETIEAIETLYGAEGVVAIGLSALGV